MRIYKKFKELMNKPVDQKKGRKITIITVVISFIIFMSIFLFGLSLIVEKVQ